MYERMLCKAEKPVLQDLINYCDKASYLFESLNSFLSKCCKTKQELRFPYGKNYGWCITHRKGKQLICDVFAEKDAFTVMLRLSNQQYAHIYEEPQVSSQQLIDNKYPCGDGGWIHFRVTSEDALTDIKKMLLVKCA